MSLCHSLYLSVSSVVLKITSRNVEEVADTVDDDVRVAEVVAEEEEAVVDMVAGMADAFLEVAEEVTAAAADMVPF